MILACRMTTDTLPEAGWDDGLFISGSFTVFPTWKEDDIMIVFRERTDMLWEDEDRTWVPANWFPVHIGLRDETLQSG